jgi:hypothetical protein
LETFNCLIVIDAARSANKHLNSVLFVCPPPLPVTIIRAAL